MRRSDFGSPLIPTLFMSFLCAACAPKFYVVDRQTVLEEEAAGSWPQFDKDVLNKSKAEAPTPFSKVPVNAKRARLLNVLNGEMVIETASTAPTPSPQKGAAK